ncbi:PspC domain-containing protein [Actinomadura scrupuli]|uniref:PspC domain-containing protein n=1 Tax=Actinomadura scrupuli TaxID=559629 RepID=UPI003D990AE8
MTEESKDRPAPATRLPRSHDRRVLAGVCVGLGRHTQVDPVVFRVGFALLVLADGWGVLLYIIAALLMPADEFRASPIEQLVKRRFDADSVLAILTALLGVAVLLSLPGSGLDGPLTLVTLFALVLLVAHGRGVDLVGLARTLPERIQGRPAEPEESASAMYGPAAAGGVHMYKSPTAPIQPEMIDLATLHTRPRTAATGTYDLADAPVRSQPAPPAPGTPADPADPADPSDPSDPFDPFDPADPLAPSVPAAPAAPAVPAAPRQRSVLAPLTLLVALLVAAVMAPIASAYPQNSQLPIVLGSGLAVIAAGLIAGSRYGRPRGLVAAGTLLSLALVTTSVAAAVPSGGRFGDVTWRPVDAGKSEQTYKIIAGQGALDLTALPLRPGQRIKVQAELGLGGMRVRLPRTARVELRARAGLGDVTVDGRITGGPRAKVDEILQPEGDPVTDPPTIELSFNGRVGDLEVTRA